jgi:uncharacterized membrane protein
MRKGFYFFTSKFNVNVRAFSYKTGISILIYNFYKKTVL